MKKIFTAFAVSLFSIFLGTNATASQEKEEIFWLTKNERDLISNSALIIAQSIDIAVQSNNFQTVYSGSSTIIKRKATELFYSKRLSTLRKSLHQPTDRVIQSIEGGYSSLPNKPDGEYAIVTYDVIFNGNSKIFTEQLILKKEPNLSANPWALASYRIAPKPTSPIL